MNTIQIKQWEHKWNRMTIKDEDEHGIEEWEQIKNEMNINTNKHRIK